MKSFNKSGLTLIELITSVAISAILFGIVIFFTTSNIEELADNTIKTKVIEEVISLQNLISEFETKGFSELKIFSFKTDLSYTGVSNPNSNNIIYLYKADFSEGVLIGIVNFDNKKLQKNYVYGNNFLGYKEIFGNENTQLLENNELLFNKDFSIDKIFKSLRIKDLKGVFYNGNKNIDLYLTIIKPLSNDLNGTDFALISDNSLVVGEYNLVF